MTALDPVEAAARLAGRPGRVLLHSGRDDDGCGRWSFVACEPEATIECRGGRVVVRDATGAVCEERDEAPLPALERFVAAGAASPHDAAPIPRAIGFLGYELGWRIEHNRPPGARPAVARRAGSGALDMWFGRYPAVYRHDRRSGEGAVVGGADAVARLRALLASAPVAAAPPTLGPLIADDDEPGYRRAIDRIHQYIVAGDVYQVNLARRLVAPVLRDGDALELYRRLMDAAPAPFGGLLETPTLRVVSGSPERFLAREVGSDRLETRPIKGTRRRSGEPAEDAAARAALAIDEKERAEHLMIVDLERNDLGRVAVTGSVGVDALGYVVELPQLYHLVSTVSCRVRADAGVAEILGATFPGGSITGAPKIRAMEIIDELEPVARGPYTGAIGWIGDHGALDLAIAIRTAVLDGGELRLHVGGGIVADSTAARELVETEEKAAGWRAALATLRTARSPS